MDKAVVYGKEDIYECYFEDGGYVSVVKNGQPVSYVISPKEAKCFREAAYSGSDTKLLKILDKNCC